MSQKKRILSGMRPTGPLHMGNLLGALANWVSTLFVQSQIKEHAELFLILGMITPVPWLERNPTYKEQIAQISSKDLSNFGFLGYPILQAADIIMYKPYGVPVGVDQAPHVEITREIARRFNYFYGNVFPEPKVILTETPKILGMDRRFYQRRLNKSVQKFPG
jgi:tryptophanyl-tRNA synthetase